MRLLAPRLIALCLFLVAPALLHAQSAHAARIVPIEQTIRAGIDRDAIDSLYIDGSSAGCTTCRFNEEQRAAYDDSWNTFLNYLMSSMLEKDAQFSELILRAYFGADGRLDYLLFHIDGTEQNRARFVAAVELVRERFRFTPAAAGPFKQCATISLGAPVQ
jgi:hypothetical protein